MVEVLNSATVGFSHCTLTGEFLGCHVSQPLALFITMSQVYVNISATKVTSVYLVLILVN